MQLVNPEKLSFHLKILRKKKQKTVQMFFPENI